MITIEPWAPCWNAAFRTLNEAWIRELFALEEEDERVLDDPEGTIIRPGGQIFFGVHRGNAVATAAMIPEPGIEGGSMELAKMAVDPAWKGRGLSNLLMHAALRYARSRGVGQVTLATNSSLTPAVSLYRRFGFEAVSDGDLHGYSRGDLAMRLDLQN